MLVDRVEWVANYFQSGGHGGRFIVGEETGDGIVEDRMASWYQVAVVLDGLQPPPDGVAAVETSVTSAIQQVGNEAVAEASAVRQDDVPVCPAKE